MAIRKTHHFYIRCRFTIHKVIRADKRRLLSFFFFNSAPSAREADPQLWPTTLGPLPCVFPAQYCDFCSYLVIALSQSTQNHAPSMADEVESWYRPFLERKQ